RSRRDDVSRFWHDESALGRLLQRRTGRKSVRRRGAKRTQEGLGVLLQNLDVDVIDRVARAVIAGIVGSSGRAAKHAGLGLCLRAACASEEIDRRYALLEKGGVVRSGPTAIGAFLHGQVMLAKKGYEGALCDRRRCITGPAPRQKEAAV